jgi:hypothetical protein
VRDQRPLLVLARTSSTAASVARSNPGRTATRAAPTAMTRSDAAPAGEPYPATTTRLRHPHDAGHADRRGALPLAAEPMGPVPEPDARAPMHVTRDRGPRAAGRGTRVTGTETPGSRSRSGAGLVAPERARSRRVTAPRRRGRSPSRAPAGTPHRTAPDRG